MKRIIITTQLVAVLMSCSKTREVEACFQTKDIILAGEAVHFENCSENASTFEWNFGDGGQATIREPSHVFERRGEYDVSLTARRKADKIDFAESMGTLEVLDLRLSKMVISPVRPNSHPVYTIMQVSSDGTTSNLFSNNVNWLDNGDWELEMDQLIRLDDEIRISYTEWENRDCTGAIVASKVVTMHPIDSFDKVGEKTRTYIDDEGFELRLTFKVE